MVTSLLLPSPLTSELCRGFLSLGQRLSAGHSFRGFPTETVSLLQEIPASPFRVKVDPSHDASKVKAEGPGLSKAGEEACVPGHPGGSAGQSLGGLQVRRELWL